jgi:hypothetical protein
MPSCSFFTICHTWRATMTLKLLTAPFRLPIGERQWKMLHVGQALAEMAFALTTWRRSARRVTNSHGHYSSSIRT